MTAKGKFSEAGQKLKDSKRALDKLSAHQEITSRAQGIGIAACASSE
jgi:hypothetical protein